MEPDNSRREQQIYRITLVGSVGNVLLLIFKFAAGFLGHSAAMIADAIHSLSDFITDIIVLLFTHIAGKPQDKEHDYGHGKFETLATSLVGIILLGVGLGIFWNGMTAVWDFIHGKRLEAPGVVALVAALVSIVVKELLYRYTAAAGRKVESEVVVANAWHHRSDALSSVGTAVGIGGAILLGEQWRILDPIAAIIVSGFIVKVSYNILVRAADELMDRSLPDDVERQIEQILLGFPGVSQPHNMRTRKIGNRAAVEVHVRMDGEMTVAQSHETTRAMEQHIRALLGEGAFVNIHVEPRKPYPQNPATKG